MPPITFKKIWDNNINEATQSRLASRSFHDVFSYRNRNVLDGEEQELIRVHSIYVPSDTDTDNPQNSIISSKTDYNNNKGDSTFLETIFNGVNILLGSGILSVSYGLRCSGLILGLILLIFSGIATNYTGKLLAKCLRYKQNMETYSDIGLEAFGQRGRAFISFLFIMELFILCTAFLILIGDNLNILFPNVSVYQMTIYGFLIILPSTWTPHLSFLSMFSIIGILASISLDIVLFYVGFSHHFDNSISKYKWNIHFPEDVFIAESSRVPMAIGLLMVCFAGHAVFPSIYISMRKRSDYPSALNIAYIISGFIYGSVAIIGYLMYGHNTDKEITTNLIDSFPGWISRAITWITILNPASKFSLALNPIAVLLEEFFLPKNKSNSNETKDNINNTRRTKISNPIFRFLVRTILASLMLLTALYFPMFDRVTALLGASFAMMVAITAPCLLYLKLYYNQLTKKEIIINSSLFLISILLEIIGTLASFFSPSN